jgi:hypothetical protein
LYEIYREEGDEVEDVKKGSGTIEDPGIKTATGISAWAR